MVPRDNLGCQSLAATHRGTECRGIMERRFLDEYAQQ